MEIPTLLQNLPLHAVAAIIAGVVVLLVPRILNYAVAAYLLVVGTLGLLPFLSGHGFHLQAVISLVAGVLILIWPAILNYVIGIYLILTGLLDAGVLRF